MNKVCTVKEFLLYYTPCFSVIGRNPYNVEFHVCGNNLFKQIEAEIVVVNLETRRRKLCKGRKDGLILF